MTSKEIAAKLMYAIMYDNGMVNSIYPEQYSLEHANNIAVCVEDALSKNSNLDFDDEVIETMACGEASEMQALIDHYESFTALNKALNLYFEHAEFEKF